MWAVALFLFIVIGHALGPAGMNAVGGTIIMAGLAFAGYLILRGIRGTAQSIKEEKGARERGNTIVKSIVAKIRQIENANGPYAQIRWDAESANIYVYTEQSSKRFQIDLVETIGFTPGFDFRNENQMKELMSRLSKELDGIHRPIEGY